MRIGWMAVLLVFIFSLTCLVRLEAEDNNTVVAGTVTESKSGEFVTGITVAIYQDSSLIGKPLRGAYTNKYGFYSIAGLPPGSYFISARGIGYEIFRQSIKLEEGQDLALNIRLNQQDIRTKEITVEADRGQEAIENISVNKVDPSLIQKLPSIGGEVDIFRALQLLPGIKQNNELSAGLYIRGGSPDQNLVLLDGVTVYNPSHLLGFLSTFNSDAIRDVKVIKGAFPAEYGGRLSSVIDMSMKEGTKDKISGTGGISLITSRLTLEGPITDNSSFMISGRRMYLDLFTNFMKDMPDYYFYDLNAKTNYKFSENDQVFLSGYFGRDVFGFSGNGRRNSDFGLLWGNSTGNLRWMHIVSPSLFTNFSVIYTNYNFQSDITLSVNDSGPQPKFTTYSGIEDYTLKADAQYYPAGNHIIKTGIEAIYHKFISNSNFGISIPDLKLNNESINALEAAWYIQDEWKMNDRWAANIGARLYYFGQGNYFDVEPRLSLTYNLTDNITLKASGAVANQFLHLLTRNDINLPTDLWFPSTSNIKPSRSVQGVLGFETGLFDNSCLLSVEGYYKKMYNLYEYNDSARISLNLPIESEIVSGTGDAYGVEVFLNKKVGSFTGWIGYTLAWTNRYFSQINNGKPFSPRYDTRHDISVVLTYELGKSWELGMTWVYSTGQAYTMPTSTFDFPLLGSYESGNPKDYQGIDLYKFSDRNAYRLPAYHRLDLNFMYKFSVFKVPFQLSMNIYNAYNRKNPFAWYIDNDPATGNKVVKQITIMPFIPTLGLSFRF